MYYGRVALDAQLAKALGQNIDGSVGKRLTDGGVHFLIAADTWDELAVTTRRIAHEFTRLAEDVQAHADNEKGDSGST